MYTFLRNASLREALLAEAPAFGISVVIAEVLYKFHSFSLECACFLLTWLAIGFVLASVVGVVNCAKTPVAAGQ